ncbi:MAG: HEAT repeat domain-containing protein [bacterium]
MFDIIILSCYAITALIFIVLGIIFILSISRNISAKRYDSRKKRIEPFINDFILSAAHDYKLTECINKNFLNEKVAVHLLLDRLDFLKGSEASKIMHFISSSLCIQKYKDQTRSKNKWKRALAASVMGRTRSLQFVNDLIPLLKDENETVVISAAVALSRIGEPSSIIYLLHILDSFNRSKIHIIIDCLIELSHKNIAFALPRLIHLLDSSYTHLRRWGCVMLGELFAGEAVPKIQTLVKDLSPEVRSSAVLALGKIGDSPSYEYISLALLDPDWHVRFNAVKALGELKSPRAIPQLSKAMLDRQWEVNNQAVYSLRLVDRTFNSFVNLLHSDFQFIRWRAAEILEIEGFIDRLIKEFGAKLTEEETEKKTNILRACAHNGALIPFYWNEDNPNEGISMIAKKIIWEVNTAV